MGDPDAIDFEAEGLLEDLEGKPRQARLALLEELTADGATLEELREAVEQHRLVLLPVDRVLAGDEPHYSPRQVAEISGVELRLLQDLFRALGLPRTNPDEAGLDEHDLESARRLQAFREAGVSDEDILNMSRVMGMAIANIAQGTREVIGRTLVGPGEDDERDLALRFAMFARVLGPQIDAVIQYVLNRHLRDQVRRDFIGSGGFEPASGGIDVSVCFVDMVGFTKLGERLPGEELGRVAGRLAEIASEAAEPPVRLIKMIGDAAMLVSRDTTPILEAALEMVEAADAEGEGFPQVRAGVAAGTAISSSGDWYGRPVNLASRITAIARPGSVLASEAAVEAAGGEEDDADGESGGVYAYSFAGERRLRGFDAKARLFRVRRASED